MRARLGLVVSLALGVGAAGGVGGCYDFGSLHGGSVDVPPADAGGGGDGAPADAADGGTCAGCWDGTLCRQGTDLAHCGLGGAMCANCDDTNPCTADRCSAGVCGHDNLTSTSCPNGVCVSGVCQCGAAGQPCCVAQPACMSGLLCNGMGTCGTCGAVGQPCCSGNMCASGICSGGTCAVCGGLSQPCCGGATPCGASTVCMGGTCRACGAVGEPCCAVGQACVDDANACNGPETCQSGMCAHGSPVTCMALDQCHDVGTCNPTSGVCPNPNKPDGTACNDGNLCTQTDSCQSGTCVGANPIVCMPLDQCHNAGTCNQTTGMCSNPAQPNGTTCNDSNACTQTDTCQTGICTGANPVVCSALDQCHDVGTCNPANGVCSNPNKPDGTACNDGNLCTQTDSCQSGVCVGSNPVACNSPDQCHMLPGTCTPATGACSYPNKPNGTACSDNDVCTAMDVCSGGQCVGMPISCGPGCSCNAITGCMCPPPP